MLTGVACSLAEHSGGSRRLRWAMPLPPITPFIHRWERNARRDAAVSQATAACALRSTELVMRTLKLLVASFAFLTYFVGMIGISALATGAIHSSLSGRALPTIVVGS